MFIIYNYFLNYMVLAIVVTGIVIISLISNQNKKIHEIERKLEQYSNNLNQIGLSQSVTSSASPVTSVTEVKVPQVETPATINPPIVTTPQVVLNEIHPEESSGKILGRIGIGALVLGIAFFLKFAFDNNWIGPLGRVLIGVLIGLTLISIGQYIRKKYEVFSEFMFGGGIAILYLSFYAAHSFYDLIDPLNTGILMVLVTALTFIFSFVNKNNKLAIFAVIGGFLTPFIIGAEGNNMMEIFMYLIILNIGVLAITIFKKWPTLVAFSIIGTAMNFMTWFFSFYKEEFLGQTIFFLIVTFLIFFIASLYRIVIYKVKSSEVDYFLLICSAFGFFGIFYHIMKPQHESMLGFYTLILSLVYIIVANVVNKQNHEDEALNIFIPGMAVAFLSIAIPIQFSGAYIAILWFVEACVLFMMSVSMSNRGFQVMGIGVYFLGIINFLGWNTGGATSLDFVPFMNKAFGILIVAIISAYIISYIYKKYSGDISIVTQKQGIATFMIIANIITLYALSTQIIFYYKVQNRILMDNYSQQSKIITRVGNPNYDSLMQNNRNKFEQTKTANKNKSNTSLSILWAVYAIILTAIGFMKRSLNLRSFGLILFIVTAIKVCTDVWKLGSLYRIISFVGLGVIALIASFVYSKYKDYLKSDNN